MQVLSDYHMTNFKGVTIHPQAREALKLQSLPVVKNVLAACNDLKKTKYFNLNITPNLSCVVTSTKDTYFGPFKSKLMEGVSNDREENSIMLKYIDRAYNSYGVKKLNTGDIPEYNIWAYNALNNIESITQIKDVILELENAAAVKALEQNKMNETLMDEKDKVSKIVDKIFKDFS